MRVGVDATSWVNRRGYGRFARNVVTRLVELDPDTTYVLYIDEATAAEADLPSGAQERRVALRQRPSEAAAANSSRSVADLIRLTRAVRRDNLDAFLFPSIYTYFPVVGVPTVVGIHDAIPEQFPDLTMPSRRARNLWRLKQAIALRRASRIFTVSKASRAVLAQRLGIEPDSLAIVSEAPDSIFYPRSREAVDGALAAVGLDVDEPYVLYVGGISPHKNVESLIDAHATVRAAWSGPLRLVLVGDLDRETYVSAADSVRARIAAHGTEDSVLLSGFVSDETLACLYSGAAAVAIPSLGEGFGLPAVEAAACGAPLLLSDLPSHHETLGDAALYFPAEDRDALAAALERVLTDRELREQLVRGGRRAVGELSWDAAAHSLGRLIEETVALPWNGRQ
jgi:glycosyltransferase involved in cell wall biosynthesis